MSTIVTFGEVLMRFSPQGVERIIQSNIFQSRFSGAEANVAISLAYWGNNVRFVSKLPDNILGDAAINSIRQYGVSTDYCVRGGERLGIYFTEKGFSQRASTVLYDRTGSSFSMSTKNDYNWKGIFKDCEWFHISGIDLVLNENLFAICLDVCKLAKQMNIKVSFDINYRSTLSDKDGASTKYKLILPYVDLLIGNESELAMLAGRDIPLIELNDFEKYIDNCYKSVVFVQEQYNLKTVAVSLRKLKSASETSWSGMIVDDNELHLSGCYDIKVTEMIGSGDAFVAGLLHCLAKGKTANEALNYAVAASCLKQTIEGDYNLAKETEVEQLMRNYMYGIVMR